MHFGNFTYKTNLHTPKMEIHSRQNITSFWALSMLRKRSYFVSKVSSRSPEPGVKCSYGKIFIPPGYRVLGCKNLDFGSQTTPSSHMNTSKILRRKECRGGISETEPARSTLMFSAGSTCTSAFTFVTVEGKIFEP